MILKRHESFSNTRLYLFIEWLQMFKTIKST